jgi:tetratricopeptide (TPR) repeat protein
MAAALVMGWPGLRGGFVGGDDHRLLLNHVLVNHPSLEHAVELFRIVHRDLYQPIPLLSFSAEFALAQALDLFSSGVQAGAWLFHLTNVLLHGVNGVLVFFVILRLHEGLGSRGLRANAENPEPALPVEMGEGSLRAALDPPAQSTRRKPGDTEDGVRGLAPAALMHPQFREVGRNVALIAAVLFAVHPLQTEVVAWLNGRMMLLSTMFALAALLTFSQWLRCQEVYTPDDRAARKRVRASRRACCASPPRQFLTDHPNNPLPRRTHGMTLDTSLQGRAAVARALTGRVRNRRFVLSGVGWAVATTLLVTLAMMSKVRAGVPVLMALMILAEAYRRKSANAARPPSASASPSTALSYGTAALWLVNALITGVFILVNLRTTAESEFFSLAGEHMTGPRVVRIVLSLAWYVQHFVWPTGLASWYPAPPTVAWSNGETILALVILVVAVVVLVPVGRTWPVTRWGLIWFVFTLADTLPIFPARNILAADRYMYLSIIGLVWIVAIVAVSVHQRIAESGGRHFSRAVGTAVGGGVVAAGILTSWHVGSFYQTAILKTERIAQLFPDTPHVWARLGWAYHKAGNEAQAEGQAQEALAAFERAIAQAERELCQANPKGWSEAYQVLGATRLKMGQVEQALIALQKAVDLAPGTMEPVFQLALAFDELGRKDEALPLFEWAFAEAPTHNPTVLRLAGIYRQNWRTEDARRTYEKALANNRYEVPAILCLAELDIETGTPQGYEAAEARLADLLDWMPENTAARVALGVAHQGLGRTQEAIQAYERAFREDSKNPVPALNLGQIHASTGDVVRALLWFERAVSRGLDTLDQLTAAHDFFISQRDFGRAAAMWENFLIREPGSVEGRAYLAWCFAMNGEMANALSTLHGIQESGRERPEVLASSAYLALSESRWERAVERVEALCASGGSGREVRTRLLQSLERFDEQHPNVPWTYGLAARLLLADSRHEAARVFIDQAEKNCHDPACTAFVASLKQSNRRASP